MSPIHYYPWNPKQYYEGKNLLVSELGNLDIDLTLLLLAGKLFNKSWFPNLENRKIIPILIGLI